MISGNHFIRRDYAKKFCNRNQLVDDFVTLMILRDANIWNLNKVSYKEIILKIFATEINWMMIMSTLMILRDANL